MSSIQAYKAHKQEGTKAGATLVSKVHKQGASTNSQGIQHNYRLAKNTKKKELATTTPSATTTPPATTCREHK